MALICYRVEIRTDFKDKQKDKHFLKALRLMTHEALATASLLADGRKPDAAISTTDMIIGATDLLLFDEDEQQDHE